MADAPRARSRALLTLTSGLGAADGADRETSLTLTGRLAVGGLESCHCCGEQRQDVALDLDFVVLTRGERAGAGAAARLPRPALRLNRGYLQRTLEHANDCHREDLRTWWRA